MIEIYCLDISNKLPKVKLPKSVNLHINKFNNLKYKKISKLAWSTLIDILQNKYKINFKKDEVLFEKGGKPYLKSNKLFFNISHSSNLIALAISDKPIGIDIQLLIPLSVCDIVYARILNKTQIKQYQKSNNKSLFLTKIWTQKESMLKLKGLTILDITKLIKVKTQGYISEVVDSKNNRYILSYSK